MVDSEPAPVSKRDKVSIRQTDDDRLVAAGSSYRPPASASRSRTGTGYPAAGSTPLRGARTRVQAAGGTKIERDRPAFLGVSLTRSRWPRIFLRKSSLA